MQWIEFMYFTLKYRTELKEEQIVRMRKKGWNWNEKKNLANKNNNKEIFARCNSGWPGCAVLCVMRIIYQHLLHGHHNQYSGCFKFPGTYQSIYILSVSHHQVFLGGGRGHQSITEDGRNEIYLLSFLSFFFWLFSVFCNLVNIFRECPLGSWWLVCSLTSALVLCLPLWPWFAILSCS